MIIMYPGLRSIKDNNNKTSNNTVNLRKIHMLL